MPPVRSFLRFPLDAPQIAVVGNLRRPVCGGDRTRANRGQAFIPATGIACIEGHGLCARSQGSEGGLQKLDSMDGDGGDFSAEVGEQSKGTLSGSDENVFFANANQAHLRHVYPFISGTSLQAVLNAFQIRSSQIWCSGFISTDRTQVTFSAD